MNNNLSRTRGLSTVELLLALAITGTVVGGVMAASAGLFAGAAAQTQGVSERASLGAVTRTLRQDGWQLISADGRGDSATLVYLDPTPRAATHGELAAELRGGQLHITGAAQTLNVLVPGSACSPVTRYAVQVLQLTQGGEQLALKRNLGAGVVLVTQAGSMNAVSDAAGLRLAVQARGVDGQRSQTLSDVYVVQPLKAPACPPALRYTTVTPNLDSTNHTALGTPVTVTKEPTTPKKKKKRLYSDADGNLITAGEWGQLPPDQRGYRDTDGPCNGSCAVTPAPIAGDPAEEADATTLP